MAVATEQQAARQLWLARLDSGQTGRMTVRSGSMAPLLNPGDVVIVVSHRGRALPGDLVVFRRQEQWVCHRIMLPRSPGSYWQKGDGNPHWGTVSVDAIVGRPVGLEAAGRRYRLSGPAFRLRNSALWLLVGCRDLARLTGRLMPRLAWPIEKLFHRPVEGLTRRIRTEGKSP